MLGGFGAKPQDKSLGALRLARTGANKFTGAQTLPGNAVNPLEAVPKQQAESIASAAATSAVSNRMQYSLTATQTASGLAVDFLTIPSWAKRITVPYTELSTNGAFNPVIQVGAGSYKTSGYTGSQTLLTAGVATSNLSSGFSIGGGSASSIRNGVLNLVHLGGNIWAALGGAGFSDSVGTSVVVGYVALSGSLDRLRLFFGGTDVADGGTVPILIEG
jgi:hypothetical protein